MARRRCCCSSCVPKAPTPTRSSAPGESVRAAFARARASLPPASGAALTLTLSGPPVFAVAARALIIREVMRLSALSSALIALLLLCVYRSLPALVLGLVPVAAGALAGVAAVALGFPAVHGITLGFGVTLIGEAVDYSIYLFVQGRGAPQRDWRRTVWPTIRLGALTSIVGFTALVPASFQGLAQLGLYSVAGLAAAALVTRYVLPAWIPARLALADLQRPGTRLVAALTGLRRARLLLLAVPILACVALYAHRGALLNRELAALSPVPQAQQQLDERLRADLGAADVRYLVAVTAATREAALEATERVAGHLMPLVDAGTIGGFEYAARYLPSGAAQQARRAALPDEPELNARLAAALAGLPVAAATLAPFVSAVEAARRAPPLTQADLAGTSFATAVNTLLQPTAAGYSALLPIASLASGDLPADAVRAVRAAVANAAAPAVLLDLKGETDRLYADYLNQAVRLSLAGFAAIVLLLALALRSVARVARVLTPLVLAVAAVTALLVATGQPLTILHLVGLLLTVAVGSNYALFFDRASHDPAGGSLALTLASLAIANLATVLAFGVLASSRLPMLADLGAERGAGGLPRAPVQRHAVEARRSRGKRLMQTLRVPATPGRRAALEVVLLPAAYSAPEDFVKAGFVEAVRARGLNLDLSFVPLELSDVTDRTIVATVLEELIAPAREHGTTVWLGGISLGGYLALCCAERAPGAIAGLALFAPYLGSYLITGEIARAGLKSWTCAAGDEADEERRIWRFLKHREAQPPLHLGLGREDRFAERHRVLAAALEPGEVDTVPGGHDWPTWRRLWDNFLDVRLVRPA